MNIKKILIIAVVLYLIVAGVQIGTPWLRNKMFYNDMDSLARALNYGSVEGTRASILEAAVSDKVPVSDKDLVVVKDFSNGKIILEAKYTVTVTTLFGVYTHVWNFNPRVEMRLAKDATPL